MSRLGNTMLLDILFPQTLEYGKYARLDTLFREWYHLDTNTYRDIYQRKIDLLGSALLYTFRPAVYTTWVLALQGSHRKSQQGIMLS